MEKLLDYFKELYLSGVPVKDIMDRLGIDLDTYLRFRGFLRIRFREMDNDILRTIVSEMVERGLSLSQIAARLRASTATARTLMKKLGLYDSYKARLARKREEYRRREAMIIDLFMQGSKLSEISRRLEIPVNFVRYIAKKHGLRRRVRLSPDVLEKIYSMLLSGTPPTEICMRLGVSCHAVLRYSYLVKKNAELIFKLGVVLAKEGCVDAKEALIDAISISYLASKRMIMLKDEKICIGAKPG
jgi:hypothetical protein